MKFCYSLCKASLHTYTHTSTNLHPHSHIAFSCAICASILFYIFNLFFNFCFPSITVIFIFQPSLLLLCSTFLVFVYKCADNMHGLVYTVCASSLFFIILLFFSLSHHFHQPPLWVLILGNRYRNADDYDDSSLFPAASFCLCLISSLLIFHHFWFKHACFFPEEKKA